MHDCVDKLKGNIHCNSKVGHWLIATHMDNELVPSVDKGSEATLKNSHASFIQISRKDFLSIQQHFIRMRSIVYKTEELELTCGESQVTYHSLCYIRTKNKPTLYYAASTTFLVPPSEFWEIKKNARFYTGLSPTKANSRRKRIHYQICNDRTYPMQSWKKWKRVQRTSSNNKTTMKSFLPK